MPWIPLATRLKGLPTMIAGPILRGGAAYGIAVPVTTALASMIKAATGG